MIKRIIAGVFIAFFLTLVGAALSTWHIEKLDTFVRFEIQKYARKNLPIDVLPGKVEVRLLPPTVTVHNIQIVPKTELATQLKPLEVREVVFQPSLLHLLIGKLHLALIDIRGADIKGQFRIKESQDEPPIQLRKILEQIPVTQVRLSEVNLALSLLEREDRYALDAQRIDATVTNDVNSLLVKLKIERLDGIYNGLTLTQDAFFETHFFLTDRNVVLSDFKFKELDTFIVASGSTQHNLAKKLIRSGNFNVRSHVGVKKARDLFDLLKKAEDPNPLNNIQGDLKTDLRLQFTGTNKYAIKASADVTGFAYEKFHVGDIDFQGEYSSDTKTVVAKEIVVKNPGLRGKITEFQMNVNDLNFKGARIGLEKSQLQEFLKYAIKKNIPADVKATGDLKCDGQLRNFRIDCTGNIAGDDIFVAPGKTPLIQIAKMTAEGGLTVNDKEVTYTAQIASGSSRGTSQGTINYKKGFEIKYDASLLSLTEIKKLSVLELEGVAKVSGSTQGNSEAATFELLLDAKGASMNQYKLGDLTAGIKYKSGKIFVDKIQGSLVSSRYLGQLMVDLESDTLVGKLQFPFVDLSVIKDSVQAHLPIPVDLGGSGSAIITIDGPLDPNRLSFKAKARLYNCRLDQQHIDTAEIDVSSVLGRMEFNSAYLEEKSSNMLFKGQMYLDRKEYDLTFSSPRVLLDDIVYSQAYSAPTKGVFQVDGKIKGTFQKPALDVKFRSDSFYLAGQKLAPIMGDVKLTETRNLIEVLGPAGLKVTYRDQKSLADIQIEGTTQAMNLAPLVTSLMAVENMEDYTILAGSNFNLKINRQDRSKINGYIFLPSLLVGLQKLELKNEKEISIFMTNGKANFAPFNMTGSGGRIQFRSASNSTSPLDIQISGLFSLSFLQIFAPFLETLEGQTSVNFRMQNPGGKLRFLGSAFIEDGFIKLPEIQHAVEDLKVDILFNQDQIIVNSLKGKFASGQLIGDGRIVMKGKKDLPVQLKLHLDNVDMNIPPQVNTIGSADFQLTGTWLPYLLSGTYTVTDGMITKEFSGSDSTNLNPHQIFLPPALRTDAVSPIRLDLNIVPTVPLKIKNTLIDGRMEGKLKVTGYPQSPSLAGNISITKNSQLNFRDVIFKVRDSSISLTGSNPPNPTLYILADARHRGYDIEMLVQGTAEKPKFKLQSTPTLTEPEIISLLTLGYTSAESTTLANAAGGTATNTLANTNNSNIGGQSSLEIGSGLFSQNPLGREFKNRFGFDVQISSRFDSATSVAVPKISATKQFTDRISGVYTVQTGKDSRREGKVRYELNRGFAATVSLQSQVQEETNVQRGDVISDILGIDLEFRQDFK